MKPESKTPIEEKTSVGSYWKWGIFYYNPADPRVWLPKRIPAMGWTLNFAHRAAYWWLVGLMAIPMGILLTAYVSEWMSRK